MPSPDARTDSSTPTTPTSSSSAAYLRDETSLRRAFDAEFAGAMAAATEKLKDASTLAPRVVETAFVNVWQQRESLTSLQHFKQVLSDEINHGAARALSRRHAASRFGGGGRDEQTMTGTHPASPQADAEEAWSRITRTIRGEGTTGQAHKAAASASRHDAAVHMKGMSKKRSWVGPIIVVVVAVAVSIWGVTKLSSLGEDDAVLASVGGTNLQPLAQSSQGQIGSTTLGDGTKMAIGPETKIFVPDGFPTKIRAVRVDGTASFEVAPGQTLPFRAVANHTHFIATGTKFAVSSFPDDSAASVMVQEGTVTVKQGKQSATVTAGQAMVADKTGIHAMSDADKAETFSWIDHKLVVQNKPLRHVVPLISRWFNSDLKVPDAPLLDRPTSIDVPLDSNMLAIKQIEQSANVKFEYEGQNKVLRDAKGAKPAAAKPAKKK